VAQDATRGTDRSDDSGAVLVTGHAGFIGSHLAERLLSRGWRVVGVDSYDDFYALEMKEANARRLRSHPAFREIRGDLAREDPYEALSGEAIDCIVHLAARAGVRPSIEEPLRYEEANLRATTRLLEFARERGVVRFVFASSSSVYGNSRTVPFSEEDPVDFPISPYAATKRAGELMAHTWAHLFGMRTICLRFFTVYGPRQRPDLAIHKFARLLAEDRPIPMYGDGSTERDYTYVDDILDGVEAAVAWTGEAAPGAYEIVNLGESRTVALSEMIRTLGEEMGITPRIERHPPQPGDVERTWADVSKAGRLLGYRPTTDFRDGLRKFLLWFEGVR
jgi:UDP-glucuronate 4-epimerase